MADPTATMDGTTPPSPGGDGTHAPPAFPPADAVLAARAGDVLTAGTLLKSDHFPGCQNKRLASLPGAPNFRDVPGLPVYGLAIPTAAGARAVLEALGASSTPPRSVLWHNMREEPVVYINGAPYVVREAGAPFANLEYTGIDRTRVESMEARLKADVLREAAAWDGAVLVAHEAADFQVVAEWEAVTEADVQTPLELFGELASVDGYSVDYVRVPVTDEKAPKDADFAALLARAWRPPPGAALVFNCQMGRGRTTTGMVIAALVCLRRRAAELAAGATTTDSGGDTDQSLLALPAMPIPGLPDWWAASAARARDPATPPAATALLHGRYACVRSLLRVLPGGAAAKAGLDAVLDAASAMQNLREAVAGYRARLAAEPDDDKRSALLDVALEYLERYCVLITFAAYLASPRADPEGSDHEPFGVWTKARPELRSVLARMLRRNPLAALELHSGGGGGGDTTHSRSDLGDGTTTAADDSDDGGGGGNGASSDVGGTTRPATRDAAAALVAARRGAVLGAATILKDDHYPGCQARGLPVLAPGAPNFRRVPGAAVWGGGTPTAAGVAAVVSAVVAGVRGGGSTTPPSSTPVTVLWVNLREEVCAYVRGAPHVLRDASRPFKNMREYVGISSRRLEAMEARLKSDALAEAGACGGRLLVAREEEVVGESAGGDAYADHRDGGDRAVGRVRDTWEPVTGPSDISTPREVYEEAAAAVAGAGVSLRYVRLPLTDGGAPRAAAVDALIAAMADAGPSAPVVITCQMGGGRTTTGMVVACLARRALHGGGGGAVAESPPRPPPPPPLPPRPTASSCARALSGLALPPHEAAWGDLASPRDGGASGGRSPRGWAIGGEPPVPALAALTLADPLSTTTLARSGGSGVWGADGESDRGGDRADVAAPPDADADDAPADPPPAEAAAFADGDYEGVARLTRLLDDGDAAKGVADAEVDRAGAVVSLRRAIARYRKPRRTFRFYRPELHARHAAFTRGATYLERYCLLIALAAYLRGECGGVHGGGGGDATTANPRPRVTFAAWLAARPDVTAALDAIRANPAAALTPVTRPPAPLAALPPPPARAPGASPPGVATGADAAAVLACRCGGTLTRGSILKAARARRASAAAAATAARAPALASLPASLDLRSADSAPVHTLGSPSVADLAAVLDALGCGPGGTATAVVTDTREELTLYAGGTPYTRRDVARPAAALHHAGVRAARLEELERRLAEDAAAEAGACGGRLLVHVEAVESAGAGVGGEDGVAGGGGTVGSAATTTPLPATTPTPATTTTTEDVTVQLDTTVLVGGDPHTAGAVTPAFVRVAGRGGDDDNLSPRTSARRGLATPRAVAAALADAGYRLTYARVPLSRDRTPQAADVDALAAQAAAEGRARSGGGDQHDDDDDDEQNTLSVVHLVIARTATGSSARFAAVVLAGARAPVPLARGGGGWTDASSGADTPELGSSPAAGGGWLASAAAGRAATATAGAMPPLSPLRLGGGGVLSGTSSPWPPSGAGSGSATPRWRPGGGGDAAAAAFNFRSILHLVRALPRGRAAKAAADAAVDACGRTLGDLRDDVVRCKLAAEGVGSVSADGDGQLPADGTAPPSRAPGAAAAARRLGLHYVTRYFFLVAFFAYRADGGAKGGGGGTDTPPSFADWCRDRRELRHLLESLSLETVG